MAITVLTFWISDMGVYLDKKYLVNTYCVPSSGCLRSLLRYWIEPCDIDVLKVKDKLNIANRYGLPS